jgi:hypothetical protein
MNFSSNSFGKRAKRRWNRIAQKKLTTYIKRLKRKSDLGYSTGSIK